MLQNPLSMGPFCEVWLCIWCSFWSVLGIGVLVTFMFQTPQGSASHLLLPLCVFMAPGWGPALGVLWVRATQEELTGS